MRPVEVTAAALAGLASFGLLAAGCGGGSPSVASVASSTTTATTSTQSGGSALGSSSAAPRDGNHTFMNLGNATQGTKFAACMRKHGVRDFPDPSPQGTIQLGAGIDPRSPAFKSAKHRCEALLPAGFGQAPTAAQLEQVQQQLLGFSECMRAHKINDFPDPSGGGLPRIQPVGDLDPNNPQFQAAYNACKGHLPAGLPGKALGGLVP